MIRKHTACLILLTALPIASAALEWPSEWVVFAPAGRSAPVLSREVLQTIPEHLTVAGRELTARTVTPTDHQFDFATLQPTPGWAPEFRREVSPQPLTRVPLRVDWGENRHADSPVTFGMPFARHALESVEQARLVDADGNPVPAEWRTTATWEGPDGPVRWARVEAVLERDRDYLVEFGAAVQSAPVAGIALRETETDITVDTGVMEVRIRPPQPGTQGGPHYRVQGDWPGENLQISGGAWFSRLRISDVARYPGAESPRQDAFEPDAHTRLLCRFDGDDTIWIDGAWRPLGE